MTVDTAFERCDLVNATALAQDLYDQLTCAGLRHNLWPATSVSSSGYMLEDAFGAISDYLDQWSSLVAR